MQGLCAAPVARANVCAHGDQLPHHEGLVRRCSHMQRGIALVHVVANSIEEVLAGSPPSGALGGALFCQLRRSIKQPDCSRAVTGDDSLHKVSEGLAGRQFQAPHSGNNCSGVPTGQVTTSGMVTTSLAGTLAPVCVRRVAGEAAFAVSLAWGRRREAAQGGRPLAPACVAAPHPDPLPVKTGRGRRGRDAARLVAERDSLHPGASRRLSGDGCGPAARAHARGVCRRRAGRRPRHAGPRHHADRERQGRAHGAGAGSCCSGCCPIPARRTASASPACRASASRRPSISSA